MFAETAIVDYRLSFADQGKQTSVSISVCSKRREVCHFHFPFAANKWKLPFSMSSICRIYRVISIYIYYLYKKHNYINICCYFKRKIENRSPGNFLYPFTICSSCKRKFVVYPFVDKEANGRYSFANRLNGLAHLWLVYMYIRQGQRDFSMNANDSAWWIFP